MGVPTGSELGHARARLTIDVSQPLTVPATMRGVAQGVERNMGRIDASVRRAESSLGALAGAFGISLGAAGAAQLARFAVGTDKIATAYARQSVAARNLAGSQAQLNELLAAYAVATGGAIDKATALSDVTRLQAIGFADSSAELERFVRAARGISIATGQQQDYVISQLQLAIANQSTMRLDQLGLGVAEVKQRIDELKAADSGLTTEMAYQNAILGLAEQKFGALTTAAEGQATGIEKLRKAWKDFQLELGQGAGGGAVNSIAEGATKELEGLQRIIQDAEEDLIRLRQEYEREVKPWPIAQAIEDFLRADPIGDFLRGAPSRFGPTFRDPVPSWMTSSNTPLAPAGSVGGFDQDQTAAITEWSRAVQDIERQAAAERLDATRQYNQQRTQTIANYEKSIAREAEDFARQRANAERQLQMSILDIAQDSARQRAKWEADLARTIAQARADSTERIAELRDDTGKRLLELEEDYARNREKAAAQHRDKLLDAAGRLDAKAVADAQRNFKRQEQDAKEAYDDQRKDLQEQLTERVADEQAALAKSIRLQEEAHARQLAEQAENDRLRIQDMKDAFAAQKAQEDIERGIRLDRQAQDHQDQLTALDTAHGDRLTQIRNHAQQERDALNTEFGKSLDALGIKVDAFIKEGERATDAAIKNFDKWLKHVKETMSTLPGHPSEADPYVNRELPSFDRGGFVPRDMLAYLHRGEYVTPAAQVAAGGGMGGGRSVSIGTIAPTIMIGDTGGRSDEYIMGLVRQGIVSALQEVA